MPETKFTYFNSFILIRIILKAREIMHLSQIIHGDVVKEPDQELRSVPYFVIFLKNIMVL